MASNTTIQTTLKLVDQASANADKISRSFNQINHDLFGLESAMGKTSSVSRFFTMDLTNLAGAAMSLAQSLASGIYSTLQFAVGASEFKRQTEMAFTYMGETEVSAKNIFDRMSRISNQVKFSREESIAALKGLRAAGFSEKDTENFFTAISDKMSIMGGKSADLKDTMHIIAKIFSSGKLQGEEIEQLGERGIISRIDLVKSVAENTGKTEAQVKTLLEQGKLTGEMGLNAILSTIAKQQGGVIGKASYEFGMKTIDGQWASFMGTLSRLFENISTGPIVNFMERLNSVFNADTESGKYLVSVINDLFNWLTGLLDNFKTEDMQNWFQAGIDSIKDLYAYLKSGEFEKRMAKWQHDISILVNLADKLVRAFEYLGGFESTFKTLGTASDIYSQAVQDAAGISGLKAFFFPQGSENSGENFREGFASGLKSGENPGTVIEKQINEGLEIHSPSKVGEKIGGYFAQGFNNGISNQNNTNNLISNSNSGYNNISININSSEAASLDSNGLALLIREELVQILR